MNNRDDGARIERFRGRGTATFVERECSTAGNTLIHTMQIIEYISKFIDGRYNSMMEKLANHVQEII